MPSRHRRIVTRSRTAQDRTGQDRTGQDRTGQDRTGQDRTGQDPCDTSTLSRVRSPGGSHATGTSSVRITA